MHWIIAAIIAPVPIFHLWLHGLLPFWRKHPLWFYPASVLWWSGSFLFMPVFEARSSFLFVPSFFLVITGWLLMAVGGLGVLSGIITLTPKRFFGLAVIKPDSVPQVFIHKGLFHFFPHPTYLSYLFVAFGNFILSGEFYLALIFVYLIILTPIVMVFEEEELRRRVRH